MKRISAFTVFAAVLIIASCSGRDGLHNLTILATDDVHAAWFDSTYSGGTRTSLFAVNSYVDSVRKADGAQNVLLIDAGDCLQGDEAAYYYNYVDTLSEHLFVRLMDYMGYDAIAVGNHDIETGHPVYDRVTAQLEKRGIPFLAGNAFRTDNGKTYWPACKVFRRGGMKVLVIGYTNPNIKAWLDESIWSGIRFESLQTLAQKDVDRLKKKTKPDVTILAIHSGTGRGDGSQIENQALDLYQSLKGVDFVLCAHDHRQTTRQSDSIALINTGNRAKFLGIGKISLNVEKGKVTSRSLSAGLIPVDRKKVDTAMRDFFRKNFETVKAFTLHEVGMLDRDIFTRDAYRGMSDYVSLVHTVQLAASGADLSFAAPLSYNGKISAGVLRFSDMFTIYPFENSLFTVEMSGREIKDYLEYSYDKWLAEPEDEHTLRILKREDPRNNQSGWSFANRFYNFDSAAGINYTVDVTKRAGERVRILGFADGRSFDSEAGYKVAMTSYRASGGGGLLTQGAGIPEGDIDGRVSGRYPEIRELIYGFISGKGLVDHETMEDRKVLGEWKFVPENLAAEGISRDMELLFGKP